MCPLNTSPCVRLKRTRGGRHHAHMLKPHGDVLSGHTTHTTHHTTPHGDRDRGRRGRRKRRRQHKRREKIHFKCGGAWPFFVDGVLFLVNPVCARDLCLLNSVKYDLFLISFSASWPVHSFFQFCELFILCSCSFQFFFFEDLLVH